ncbi:SusC/RagA family TonB-linked outer membrane protein [Chryseolinea lacunae]|uniref:TonB-dependent receptor n=1 Tax=Chryseolinea lacunae TaxID=2801331 RepID=A0ABS1KWM1_9BACT|nr:TonB-dependent receptor [Chryseolinea lacunae]MBL0743622.1 TonB-dependent receptor [Chryseolinea lacunae]
MTKFYLCLSRYLAVLLVLASTVAWSQSKTVTGKVTSSEDGGTLPGVNVVEKGTSNGTITDVEGRFSITVGNESTLVFSFVGFKAQEVAVGGRSSVDIVIEPDVTALSEVVVIGYGQIEKKDATGALVSLKPGDFNGGVISSPEQLIQGRAAGVQITSASGEPGAGVNIRIRGTSSVRAGSNPLFVVDGVPLAGDDVTSGGSGAGLGMSSARNPLNFINPNDIASIDILKDASATAIYGSRGANGVVLITTKSGKGGSKGSVDYSYNLSVGKITKKYDLLNRDEFLAAYTSFNTPAAAAALDGGANTDWQNEILRTAVTHQHNLSFGAGDKTSNYRFSVGYMDQEGIVRISGLKRYTARFNGSKSFINDKLKISTQLTLSNTKDSGAPITDNSGFEGDLLGSALKANPTLPVRKPDGTFNQISTNEPNPAAILAYTRDNTNTLRALGNISAEVQIVKNLSFKSVVGFDRSMSTRKTALSKDLLVSGVKDAGGRLFINDIQTSNDLWENYFTYDKKAGDISINAMIGYSYQKFNKATAAYQFANFKTSDLDMMINNFASADQKPTGDPVAGYKVGAVGTNSSNVTDELQSYFGRVNVGLSNKYIVTATLRADGSTKFGGNNKYGYFPSAAVKWRIIEEQFTPKAFSDLNLRVGYGITGNQDIPHNLYDKRQRFGDWGMNNTRDIQVGSIGDVAQDNPNLKWESTSQFNVGIDYGFFENRLRGSLDYYHKKTNDLLLQISVAQPSPVSFYWTNVDASVINKGIEISLEGDVVANDNFKWTVVANAAFNSNMVKDYTGIINTGQINGQGLSGAYAQRIYGDQPLFAWFVRDFVGYNENGIAQYRDNDDRQKFVGKSPIPKANAGLTNNLKYKHWDFSVFLNGQFGHYLYNNTANAFFTAGALANGRNTTKDVVGNGEGRLNSPDVSTRFLENGSFVRLQNVTLGYNIPVANTVVQSLRVFVTGQNLFVITNYTGQDPEVNTNKSLDGVPSLNIDYTSYPRSRTFTFGVNASF